MKPWYYIFDERGCTEREIIICAIVQGSFFDEHMHIIDKTLNNNGSKMEPWGTPSAREIHLLLVFSILTFCLFLFTSKSHNWLIRLQAKGV